jgi:CheY-like chemotaxis protein
MSIDPSVANPSASQGQATILFVEDEIITRFSISEELRSQGYQVIEAASGDEALSVLRATERVDVVVTDLRMPGSLNGSDLVRLIRREFPGLKVVMLSGNSPDAEVRALLDEYISKPIFPPVLGHRIRKLTSSSN